MLAHFGKEGVPESVVPKISQETLAEMVGTTRSRVCFFMNRFRKLGFIRYAAGKKAGCRFTNLFSTWCCTTDHRVLVISAVDILQVRPACAPD
jgi:hypothetical protein